LKKHNTGLICKCRQKNRHKIIKFPYLEHLIKILNRRNQALTFFIALNPSIGNLPKLTIQHSETKSCPKQIIIKDHDKAHLIIYHSFDIQKKGMVAVIVLSIECSLQKLYLFPAL
jgi:hypothetical protein